MRTANANLATSCWWVLAVSVMTVGAVGCASSPDPLKDQPGRAALPSVDTTETSGSGARTSDPVTLPVAANVPSVLPADDVSRYHLLLRDPDEGVRIAAARALLERGDMTGKPVLLEALHDEDVHHRIDGALALQKLTDPETVRALRQAAEGERHPLARSVFKQVLKGNPR